MNLLRMQPQPAFGASQATRIVVNSGGDFQQYLHDQGEIGPVAGGPDGRAVVGHMRCAKLDLRWCSPYAPIPARQPKHDLVMRTLARTQSKDGHTEYEQDDMRYQFV